MPNEDYPDWSYGEPCPECGSTELGETCKTHGTLYVTENGDIDDFIVSEMGQAIAVKCFKCDTSLMNKLE
jgi:hypothetical protein